MPLVLGFAGLLGMVLLLTSAVSGASFRDVIAGKAGELYREHEQDAATAAATPAAGATPATAAPVPASRYHGSAAKLLQRLTARNVHVDRSAFAALHVGRVDQGLDFGGAGPVKAIAEGVVRHVGLWPGWPGHGGVVYDTALGPVFVMEDFAPSVRVGQRVRAGQIIGHATGGSSGIEAGLANASHTGPLIRYDGDPDGTAEPGGLAFAALLGYDHTLGHPHG